MPIECCLDARGKKVHKYEPLPERILYDQLVRYYTLFLRYCEMNELGENDVFVDKSLIAKLLTRVDKRKEYFRIFHDETYINDIKEAALIAYWIIKFKPISLCQDRERPKAPTDPILRKRPNEGFAAFVILTALKEISERRSVAFSISKEYGEKLMYGLTYWDISKEAMMLVAETLAEKIGD